MNSGYLLKVEHDEFAKRIEEENIRTHHRLKHLEDQEKMQTEILLTIKELTMETRDLRTETKDLKTAVLRQGERLETLENQDGETWKKVKWYVLTVVLGAFIGFLMNIAGF